jgi:hypothetical protein
MPVRVYDLRTKTMFRGLVIVVRVTGLFNGQSKLCLIDLKGKSNKIYKNKKGLG